MRECEQLGQLKWKISFLKIPRAQGVRAPLGLIILFMRPEHVTRIPTNCSAVLLPRISVCITWTGYCTAIRGSSGQVILTYILHYYCFWHNLDKVVCQFIKTGTSDRCLIQVSFNFWDAEVSVYTPFHFSFTVPLSFI